MRLCADHFYGISCRSYLQEGADGKGRLCISGSRSKIETARLERLYAHMIATAGIGRQAGWHIASETNL